MLGRFKRKAISRPLVLPGVVSAALTVPRRIRYPPYVGSLPPVMESVSIRQLTGKEVALMRDASQRAATALQYAGSLVRPGITTDEIDRRVHEFILGLNCYPSPLGYNGFPKSICTSINEVMCHGIPDDRPLLEGESVNIDVSVYTEHGVHGDCSDMFAVGKIDEVAQQLIDVTRQALTAAIACCAPGVKLSQIGQTVHDTVKKHSKFNIVDDFTGHGIFDHFHMMPYILHTPNTFPGVMKEGHTFTIEPVITEGSTKFKILQDNWTARAEDLGRSAQIEHTILITQSGAEILSIPVK